MIQVLLPILVGGTLGITALAISLMAVRAPHTACQWPLAVLLLTVAVLASLPLVAQVMPEHHTSVIALGWLALMLLGPLFLFYVQTLTSESKWRLSWRKLLHFVPALAALGIVVSLQALPLQAREAMVSWGQLPEGTAPSVLTLQTWLLILLWVPQSVYYLIRSGRRLSYYRGRIKHMFANTEKRKMTWLVVFVIALGAIWLLTMAIIISSHLFNYSVIGPEGVIGMALILVWVLSVYGLGQRPGYEGHYLSAAPVEQFATPVSGKHSRSALDEARCARIAINVENAMVIGKLYLNADLTLSDLARAVGAAPNYVSQTLNETMGETFFDYVNKKRVEAAQGLLLASDKTALEVGYDVGFNAESSFCKAFRRVTGVAPDQYRQPNKTRRMSR